MPTEQLTAALALQPDLATVVVGINDVLRLNADLAKTGMHIAAMFAALTAADATVATFTFPDLSAVMPISTNTYIRNVLYETRSDLTIAPQGHRPSSARRRGCARERDRLAWTVVVDSVELSLHDGFPPPCSGGRRAAVSRGSTPAVGARTIHSPVSRAAQ